MKTITYKKKFNSSRRLREKKLEFVLFLWVRTIEIRMPRMRVSKTADTDKWVGECRG